MTLPQWRIFGMQGRLWDHYRRGTKGEFRYRLVHGGVRKTGKRKDKRPFIPGAWSHLILKSKRAVGEWRLSKLRNDRIIAKILRTHARKNFVRLGHWVNAGNHLHIELKFRGRREMQRFLRVVPGLIARQIMGAEKGEAKGRFWDGLAFTRIMTSSLERFQLRGYFSANNDERNFGRDVRQETLAQVNFLIREFRRASVGLPSAPS
jgi:hypothetical protein